MKRLDKSEDPFIKQGYMGLCLFLFWYYSKTNDERYYVLAQKTLHKSCSLIKRGDKLSLYDGLCGIGISIMYFHRKRFVSGDLTEILTEVDDEIYKSVIREIDCKKESFSLTNHEEALTDVVYYTSRILKSCGLTYTERQIQEKLLHKIVNEIYQRHDYTFYLEPIPFSTSYYLSRFLVTLGYAYRIDSLKTRIIHMWNESRMNVLSQNPFLDCNKALLYSAVKRLASIFPEDSELEVFVQRLGNEISITRILNQEIPADSMSVLSGLSGIVLKLYNDFGGFGDYKKDIISKMEKSCYFNAGYDKIIADDFVGFNGILGFIMAYLTLK